MACNGMVPVRSWNDFPHRCPTDPRDAVAYIKFGNTVGVYKDSDTYKPSSVTWVTPVASLGTSAMCVANRTDDLQDVAEAEQWNIQNKMISDDTDLPPVLQKVMFVRAGNNFTNEIEITLGGVTYTDIEFSFRNNAATRGDAQGTIPVFSFTGAETWTGGDTLFLTIKQPGDYIFGLRLIDNSSNYYFIEIEMIAVDGFTFQ